MACADCWKDMRQMKEALESIHKEAKRYAIENEKTVYIYQTEMGWAFMEEEKAIEHNIIPTGGVVSQYQRTTA